MSTSAEEMEETSEPMIRWKRWWLVIALLIVVGVLWVWDGQLKKTDIQGYRLVNAEWTIEANNVPRAWQSLYASDKWAELLEGGNPLWEPMVDLRKKLGVRLSPERWQTWLGSGATLSGTGEEWMLSIRPGVLARILDLLNGSKQQYGPFHYRWHDGFLCISRSRGILDSIQDDGRGVAVLERKGGASTEILLSLIGPSMAVEIDLSSDWPVKGTSNSESVDFATTQPFASVPVLQHFEPQWEMGSQEWTFQGTVDVPEEESDVEHQVSE